MANLITKGEGVVGALAFTAGGENLYKADFGTTSLNPGSIGATTRGSVTFTLTGAKTTDVIIMNPPADLNDDLLFVGATVSAADTVTVYLYNPTAGSIDDSARTWSYLWLDTTAG
jgi:hypothetical protein